MDHFIGELEVYPEIKTYTLINNFTNDETLVTEAMLNEIFPDESNRMKVLTGRHRSWTIIEN